jgi:dTDP-4-dehydrorhamnose 3,5-epimerase
MKILEVKNLAIEGVKVIRFGRFPDPRGYFVETFKQSDTQDNSQLEFLKTFNFVQNNESFSKAGVVKGLHFQWDPPLGKLLRTISGHMVDMILDIRKNSSTYGKIILYDLPASSEQDFNEWIWLPPGMAHGSFFVKDSFNEYLFSANYNPKAEGGISPLSADLDWSLADSELKNLFIQLTEKTPILSEKDKQGLSFKQWDIDPRSKNFLV